MSVLYCFGKQVGVLVVGFVINIFNLFSLRLRFKNVIYRFIFKLMTNKESLSNCITSNKHTIKSLRFFLITNWDGGDYNLRSTHAAKHIWVVVIRNWGGLPSLPLYREYVSGRLPHPQALDGHLGNLIINRKLYRGKEIDRSLR